MGIHVIKANSSEHFRKVAQLHRDGITEGFLSTLGISFLLALYRGIAKIKNSGVLVAVDGGGAKRDSVLLMVDGESRSSDEILGFISYSKDVKSCYKQVLFANFTSLSLAMIPNVFKLAIYKKVFETLLYPFLHKDTTEDIVEAKKGALRPELLSMAVSENARGKGIGKLLVKAVDDAMIQMHVEGYYVVTHGIDERSNGFYQRCGFDKIHEFKNHGKPMNEYYKKLG